MKRRPHGSDSCGCGWESTVSRCAYGGLLLLPASGKKRLSITHLGGSREWPLVAGCASAGIRYKSDILMRDGVHVRPEMLPGGIWHADEWAKVLRERYTISTAVVEQYDMPPVWRHH